jgi:hypothetical protein
MGITDSELHTAQTALDQSAQEAGPEGGVLLPPTSRSKMERSLVSRTPIAITTAIETIRWFWRTFR